MGCNNLLLQSAHVVVLLRKTGSQSFTIKAGQRNFNRHLFTAASLKEMSVCCGAVQRWPVYGLSLARQMFLAKIAKISLNEICRWCIHLVCRFVKYL